MSQTLSQEKHTSPQHPAVNRTGIHVPRRFTTPGVDVFDAVKWDLRRTVISNPDGSTVFAMENIEVPASWSQLATDIVVSKYFRKAGVPNGDGTTGPEKSARQVIHRLAGCWRHWGETHGYFDSAEDAQAFYDDLAYMLVHQVAAPNSPQWFNTGLHWAYGITGPAQGHWYVDPSSDVLTRSTSAYERPQPHACFIQSVADDLVNEGGIMDLWVREARLFKYGSGTGTNFSSLRGEGERLQGGGKSSGLMSFLKIGDRAAGAIKSGGTTRRAAKMVIVDTDHPDIEQFIDWKVREEQKVAALVTGSKINQKHLKAIMKACVNCEGSGDDCFQAEKNPALKREIKLARRNMVPDNLIQRVIQFAKQGYTDIDFPIYDTDWDSEAYLTVSGQNSNNSVRVTDEFLRAVEADREWALTERTTGRTAKTVKAAELWDRIAEAAWHSADPGVQFDTTINDWHTCPNSGRINASNPCSEYMFLDDTACNLASLNLLTFRDEKTGAFDVAGYEHVVRLWTVVLEISVLMAQFPSKEIAQLSYDYRTLGLGYANLGSMLMVSGIPYDSEESRAIAGAITAIMNGIAYKTSAEMAASLGAFPKYKENKKHMLRVMRNHRAAAYDAAEAFEGIEIKPMGINAKYCPDYLLKAATKAWDDAVQMGEKHGYRNAQATVIAPTGTIGLVMDCDTTGVEPDFALVKFKKLSGGGYFKIINQSIPAALKKLGYTTDQADAIVKFAKGHGTFAGAPFINHQSLSEKGFISDELKKLDSSVESAFEIGFVFNHYNLGEECLKRIGFTPEQYFAPDFNLLEALGFSDAEIDAANDYVCGTMTVEGAPFLKEEHLAVFDCANKCGKKGERYIHAHGHIRMMGAVQPFISGAISKTINLPNEATVDEIKDCYYLSWQLGLKACALYRDGSKLSQPLSNKSDKKEKKETKDEAPAAEVSQIVDMSILTVNELLEEVNRRMQASPDTQLKRALSNIVERKQLPAKRRGYTIKGKVGGQAMFLRTGEYSDGTLGEIFIDMAKEGATMRSMLNSFAIAISIGLQ